MKAGLAGRTIVYIKFRVKGAPAIDSHLPENVWDCCTRLTPLIEPLQPDNGFLDLTGCGESKSLLIDLARNLRDTGVEFDCGVSSSKLVARIAHDVLFSKYVSANGSETFLWFPDQGCRCLTVMPGNEPAFLERLPLQYLWQFPDSVLDQLRRLGILTIGELRRIPLAELITQIGQIGQSLNRAASGIDPSRVKQAYPPRELARRLSLDDCGPGAILDSRVIANALERISSDLSENLRKDNLVCGKIELTLIADSGHYRVQRSLKQPSNSAQTIAATANGILVKLRSTVPPAAPGRPGTGQRVAGIREIVIRAQELESAGGRQLRILEFGQCRSQDNQDKKEEKLQRTLSSLKNRFGENIKLGTDVESSRLEKLLALLEVR